MANYIDREIICEAYSHLDSEVYKDKDELKKLENNLKKFFEERAKFLFGEDVEIEIEFSDGSLISKLRVIGSTALILGTLVSDYGSFRQGVDQITKDSELLAQSTNLEVIFRTRTNYCDRVAIEKRKGIFGRTKELINSLDSVKDKVGSPNVPTNEGALEIFNKGTKELVHWDVLTDKLFEKIDSSETKVCIASGFVEELKKLPQLTPWTEELNRPSFKTTLINSDPILAGAVNGASSMYTATIKSVIKKMTDRILQNVDKKT